MPEITKGQIKQLFRREDSGEVDHYLFQFILENFANIRKMMLGAAIKLIMRRDSVKERVAAGKYDWSNENINDQRFQLTLLVEEQEVVLFHPNKVMTSEQIIQAMAEADLEPALIDHLLAFGEQQPEVQREFPVVCLGSSTELDGGRHVPCLLRDGSRRKLYLYWFDYEWREDCRFLAVRKRS